MSSLVLTGDTSGSVTVTVPAVAGSNTATIGAATGTHYPFTAGTAVASTSGTSIDFTGIPSWVKRITVMFAGVSTNGTSNPQIQIGDSGGIETTGYVSTGSYISISSVADSGANTTGFITGWSNSAATNYNGAFTLTNLNSTSWVCVGSLAGSDGLTNFGSGAKTLSDTLTQVRITTVNGTDTFDAGSINILYE